MGCVCVGCVCVWGGGGGGGGGQELKARRGWRNKGEEGRRGKDTCHMCIQLSKSTTELEAMLETVMAERKVVAKELER